MHLLTALNKTDAAEIDPDRPLRLGPIELGLEAANEAIRIAAGGSFPNEISLFVRSFEDPIYWTIAHQTEDYAEIFGFPAGTVNGLPTAVELALVRAVAIADPQDHPLLLGGGVEVALGTQATHREFCQIIRVARRPALGQSLLYGVATQAIVYESLSSRLSLVVLNCLSNSFRTLPLKYRYLELYRIFEARYLADTKETLIQNFDSGPGAALNEALSALKSEVTQITNLVEHQSDAVEACWTVVENLRRNLNSFAIALFRRLDSRLSVGSGRWRAGAGLIYQIRCAIVHAGEKDLIYENFSDAEIVVQELLPFLEKLALLTIGVELLV